MRKSILISASLLSLLCIILGAFAGHGLVKIVDQYHVSIFRMSVQYQMFGCLGLWIIGIFKTDTGQEKWLFWSWWCMLFGMICFCGMLYTKSLWFILNIQIPYILELITPFGGFLMVFSWLFLSIHFIINHKPITHHGK